MLLYVTPHYTWYRIQWSEDVPVDVYTAVG